MNADQLQQLLHSVADREISIADAMSRLRNLPFEQLPFATLDHHRSIRCGHPEVIFCPNKTPDQVVEIARRLSATGQPVLATRATPEQVLAVRSAFPAAVIDEPARAILINPPKVEPESTLPPVLVISAGTADFPIAAEAMLTLRAMSVRAHQISDVGVAGVHRLLSHVATLQRACAIVVIAGMEGALPSVVGGLVACPVFAVPTSVGYGASFGGLSALLGMLNSCSANVSVNNIDNGFGAAFSAALVFKQIQIALARPDAPPPPPTSAKTAHTPGKD